MRLNAIRCCSGLALAMLLIAPAAMAMDSAVLPVATAEAMAQTASPQAIAEYRRKLAEYQQARGAYEQEISAYWSLVVEKRRGRNTKRRENLVITADDYVLAQPPIYGGLSVRRIRKRRRRSRNQPGPSANTSPWWPTC